MNNLIDEILNDCNYKNNIFFTNLVKGDFSKEDFIHTQIQFFHAVSFFPRPMAALAAKIPTPDLRLEVIRNVWQEHGEGDLACFHKNTFIELLSRLANIDINEIEKYTLWPEVRAFNTTLIGACVLDDYLIGAGVMGIIERMFCDISTHIGQSIVQNAWLKDTELIHYNLHAELDIKHSEDFFDVLKPSWEDKTHHYAIEQGLRLGATIFYDLYTGLYRARKRRWVSKQ